jgi:hypothetical protein
VSVCVRLRALSVNEVACQETCAWRAVSGSQLVEDPPSADGSPPLGFARVFGPDARQDQVYEHARPVVQSFLQGAQASCAPPLFFRR